MQPRDVRVAARVPAEARTGAWAPAPTWASCHPEFGKAVPLAGVFEVSPFVHHCAVPPRTHCPVFTRCFGPELEALSWVRGSDFGTNWRVGKILTSLLVPPSPNQKSQIPMSQQFNRPDRVVHRLSHTEQANLPRARWCSDSSQASLSLLGKPLRDGYCKWVMLAASMPEGKLLHSHSSQVSKLCRVEWTRIAQAVCTKQHTCVRSTLAPHTLAHKVGGVMIVSIFRTRKRQLPSTPRSPPGIYMGVGELGESIDSNAHGYKTW